MKIQKQQVSSHRKKKFNEDSTKIADKKQTNANAVPEIQNKINDDEKLTKEFIELSFNKMSGEFIRNWLYDDFLKEQTYENMCI